MLRRNRIHHTRIACTVRPADPRRRFIGLRRQRGREWPGRKVSICRPGRPTGVLNSRHTPRVGGRRRIWDRHRVRGRHRIRRCSRGSSSRRGRRRRRVHRYGVMAVGARRCVVRRCDEQASHSRINILRRCRSRCMNRLRCGLLMRSRRRTHRFPDPRSRVVLLVSHVRPCRNLFRVDHPARYRHDHTAIA